jgi:Spy/CpxP family protein refolding chaperone
MAVAGLGFLASMAMAAPPADAPREGRGGPRAGGPRGGPRGPEIGEQIIKELGLAGDKEKQVKQILDTYRQDMDNWNKQSGEEMRKLFGEIRAAREAKKDDEAKAAQEKLEKLMAARGEKREALVKQLGEVLDKDQMEKVKSILAARRGPGGPGMGPAALLERVGLTDDQKAKAKAIMDAAEEASKGKTPEESADLHRKAFDQITKEVLTDQQRAKLEEFRRAGGRGPGAMFEGLNLTEEQKAKAEAIMAEARKKGEASPDARREIFGEAMKKVSDEVLNDAQRKQLEERRKAFESRRGGGGGRPGGAPAPEGAAR